jgi:hypothetical protein
MFPTQKDIPNGWICRYSEYLQETEEWFALFEYPEYSQTEIIIPPSLSDQDRHTIYDIYPFYEDIGMIRPHQNIFSDLGEKYLSDVLPDHNPNHPVSTYRSTIGQFDWEEYPTEYRDNSTYYRNYPLQYKDAFANIGIWTELVKMMDQFPQCFENQTYTTELYLNRSGLDTNELFVHTGIALPDQMRETLSNSFDLPSQHSYSIDDRIQIGRVVISLPEYGNPVAEFMRESLKNVVDGVYIHNKYKDLVQDVALE